MKEFEGPVYICTRCLQAEASPGDCPRCEIVLVECFPGSQGDPQRKPMMDNSGQVRTRAPMWWLRHSVGRLVKKLGGE